MIGDFEPRAGSSERKPYPAAPETTQARTIFITGDTVSPDTRTFLQQVNNPVLAKPFRVRDVRETIGQILSET